MCGNHYAGNLETVGGVLEHSKEDARDTTHLLIKVKTSTPEYLGYKVSFAAHTISPQFKSFKANFNVSQANVWTIVAVPWESFSNDWSPFTGDCDTKDPTGKQVKAARAVPTGAPNHPCCDPCGDKRRNGNWRLLTDHSCLLAPAPSLTLV